MYHRAPYYTLIKGVPPPCATLAMLHFGLSNLASYLISPQILVKNHFCGVNFIDIMCRKGFMSQRFGVNETMGFEGSGVVEKVGEGVQDLAVGDKVAYMGLGVGKTSYYIEVLIKLLDR